MEQELRILILEDIPEEANLIERAIRRERIPFVSRRVDSRVAYMNALVDFEPDIVLSDHALPEFNSIEALKLCRAMSEDLPFILVTGTVSEEFAVTCLKQGADDYVLKSNLTRLPTAIRNAINHHATEEMKRMAEAEIKHQNEQLVHANAALKKTNTELDNFVYSVSHNLRGPVSSIQGLINLAQSEPTLLAPGPDSKYYEMIQTSINTLDRTITEIIHYSQNARIGIQAATIDLRQLFLETFSKLSYLKESAAITLSIDIRDNTIVSDRFRLAVIFNNLLTNSIKYADPFKEQMVISLTQRKEHGKTRLVITDNGIGIRDEIMPYIYNMFYRGTERSDGAGLGLYIVREAVDKLGGTIAIESHEGKGTSVTILLPDLDPRMDSEVSEMGVT